MFCAKHWGFFEVGLFEFEFNIFFQFLSMEENYSLFTAVYTADKFQFVVFSFRAISSSESQFWVDRVVSTK